MKKPTNTEIADQGISTKNIFQRINAVMKEVSYIQKEDRKVNNQYRFVSHDQVSAALHDPMARHGIVILPSILELTQDGNKTIVKLEVSFVNIDNPSDHFKVIHYGYGIDPSDKGVGKAVSYACKYAMLKTFCLETGDDPERDNIDHVPADNSFHTRKLKEEIKAILDTCTENEQSYVIPYIDAMSDHYRKTDEKNWEKNLVARLISLNGTIKAKAFKWSTEQST